MYDAVRRDFALSASFVLECFDGSEVTTTEKVKLCCGGNKIKICSGEGRDEGQQLKPIGTEASFGTTVITATILFIISIFSSSVTVNVLVFVLRVVFFSSNCVYRDAIHVRCCASGFCIISKFCARVF